MAVKHKMTSLDHRARNERDIPLLMEIADEAICGWISADEEEYDQPSSSAVELRTRFEAIRDRRAAEDAGERLP